MDTYCCDSCGVIEQAHPRDPEHDTFDYFGYWCISCRAEYEIANLLQLSMRPGFLREPKKTGN